tara:strand:+ start:79078 stop:80079 length:1002 start_codon:yes stop_codon:yes gene_type:complete
MPTYRFILPVRAIGDYRLPDTDIYASGITLLSETNPTYSAHIGNIEAKDVNQAYKQACQRAEDFFCYLALLGDKAAFILDGRERVKARNVELEQNPISENEAPPPFESLTGTITEAGQEYFSQRLDPTGEKRKSGAIFNCNAQLVLIAGQELIQPLCEYFKHHINLSHRVRTALEIIHDAACSQESSSAFALSYTALEVLTSEIAQPTLLDNIFEEMKHKHQIDHLTYKSKKQFLRALRSFLAEALFQPDSVDRIANYMAQSQAFSKIDIFFHYLQSLGIEVSVAEIREWNKIRGSLVHAAEADDTQIASMARFREIVRAALTQELKGDAVYD